jgi:NADH:ubiquinone oxidoreductase subunit D
MGFNFSNSTCRKDEIKGSGGHYIIRKFLIYRYTDKVLLRYTTHGCYDRFDVHVVQMEETRNSYIILESLKIEQVV